MATVTLKNEKGFLTYEDADGDVCCVGYLVVVDGKAFDTELGILPGITEEQANKHNELFDKANIAGLDKRCAIGQGSTFYIKGNSVRTFLGTEVGKINTRKPARGGFYWFIRDGKKFQGGPYKSDGDGIFFRRLS